MSPVAWPVPSLRRRLGALALAAATGGLCWFVGIGAGRAVGLCVLVAVLALAVRFEEPLEQRWPDRPAPRTRPGRQEVALTARQVEGARTDAGDRALLAERLRRLDARAGAPSALDDVRRAAGLARRGTTGTPRSSP
ncbi:hypothetical protein [Aquipuribacter sp. SD81]|uniref:hypothetical protein n=1 Tax=Aquipuribacter sp. SD81 TaxID=3127703 RepID=UPI003019894F